MAIKALLWTRKLTMGSGGSKEGYDSHQKIPGRITES